jgi:hypothetical protein
MGVYLFIYFWGGFFGDDFFHNLATKRKILKLGIPQPFYTFLKAHKNYLSKNSVFN